MRNIISLASKTTIPNHVIFHEIDGEAAILNLETELYHSLDEIGSRMWRYLGRGNAIVKVVNSLLDEFEVSEDKLKTDVINLAETLVKAGLLHIENPADPT